MSELILYPKGTKLDNAQRRNLARVEMAHYPALSLFRYMLVTNHVRHLRRGSMVYHSVIDALNIVDDFENEPRVFLRQLKTRLKKSNPQLFQKMIQLKIPSWDNQKLYNTDMIDTGWLFWLIAESKGELANKFKSAFADMLNRNPEIEAQQIAMELDKEVSWTGTRISLQMQSIYEIGDYDEDEWWKK